MLCLVVERVVVCDIDALFVHFYDQLVYVDPVFEVFPRCASESVFAEVGAELELV